MHRVAQPARLLGQVGAEDHPGDDLQGQLVHLGGEVERLVGRPAREPAQGVFDHQLGVGPQSPRVEVSLNDGPMACPRRAVRNDQAFPFDLAQGLHLAAQLAEAVDTGGQHLADQLGAVDEIKPDPAHAHEGEIAVFPSHPQGEAQGIGLQARWNVIPNRPSRGPGGYFAFIRIAPFLWCVAGLQDGVWRPPQPL